MNKNGFIYGMIGLMIGLAVGFFGANYLNRNSVNEVISETPITPVSVPGGTTNPGTQIADVQKVLGKAKSEPDNYEAQIEAGAMYSKIKKFEKAFEFYERAQKIRPHDFAANVKLGNVYFDAQQYEKAEVVYAKAIEINPKDPNVRTDFGLTFFLRKPADTERAIAEYRKSLAIDPNPRLRKKPPPLLKYDL